MLKEIEKLNKAQIESKRPVVEKDAIRYEWQDGSLMELLCSGIEPYQLHYSSGKRNEEAYVALERANAIISDINSRHEYLGVESAFAEAAEGLSEDGARVLADIEVSVAEQARARKGLLIYGEGGIGKTHFLYELVEKLAKTNRPYVVAFDKNGIAKLGELGIPAVEALFPSGFTCIIDACNELDDQVFAAAFSMLNEALAIEGVNVIVTTRKESPSSRLSELMGLLPCCREFEGVDPYSVFDLLSAFPEQLLMQYQDMLLSRNPRNLNAMKQMLSEFRAGEDGRKAIAQRTALIERSVKASMKKDGWLQTKAICKHLYRTKQSVFSYEEAKEILGDKADAYITNMLSEGFIVSISYSEPEYTFSSESQMQILIARSLNDDLDDLPFDEKDPQGFAERVAELVADKSNSIRDQEMSQVAVDRYCDHGAGFILMLMGALTKNGVRVDGRMVLTQTVFPFEMDFSEVTAKVDLDPCEAFYNYAGFLNTPFNLKNYSNKCLLENPSMLDSFFRGHWRSWELSSLIQRVQSIADYVAHTKRLSEHAREEWTWLALWSAMSPNKKLRTLGQRLLFVVCDVEEACVCIAVTAWNRLDDVYARRAISKALASLSDAARENEAVSALLQEAARDPDITDSIVIANLCRATGGLLSPIEFSSRNVYEELGVKDVDEDDMHDFSHAVFHYDLMNKGFFPFDIYQANEGFLRLSDRFFEAPIAEVRSWNQRLNEIVRCGADGECQGITLHPRDFSGVNPVCFEIKHLDERRLMRVTVLLAKKWFEHYGGSLSARLGQYGDGTAYQAANNPNLKPLDLAVHELLGSLSANYYVDGIEMYSRRYGRCGFQEYKEPAYEDPKCIHTYLPAPSVAIDRARQAIAERVASPAGKNESWFSDIVDTKRELLAMNEPIVLGPVSWIPVAFRSRKQVWEGNDLCLENIIDFSVGFDVLRHIDGGSDDRYLTIEHEEFQGNLKNYADEQGSLCLDAPEIDENCVLRQPCSLLLPPPAMVKYLDLEYDTKTGCFVDRDSKQPAIRCDGNPGNIFRGPAYALILLREDLYSKLARDNRLTFFAYTERFNKNMDEVLFGTHWEFAPDLSRLTYYSNERSGYFNHRVFDECRGCCFSSSNREARSDQDTENNMLAKILSEYGLPEF